MKATRNPNTGKIMKIEEIKKLTKSLEDNLERLQFAERALADITGLVNDAPEIHLGTSTSRARATFADIDKLGDALDKISEIADIYFQWRNEL